MTWTHETIGTACQLLHFEHVSRETGLAEYSDNDHQDITGSDHSNMPDTDQSPIIFFEADCTPWQRKTS